MRRISDVVVLAPGFLGFDHARIMPDPDLAPAVHIARFLTVARSETKPTSTAQLFEMLHALTAKDQGVGFVHRLVDALNEAILATLSGRGQGNPKGDGAEWRRGRLSAAVLLTQP